MMDLDHKHARLPTRPNLAKHFRDFKCGKGAVCWTLVWLAPDKHAVSHDVCVMSGLGSNLTIMIAGL